MPEGRIAPEIENLFCIAAAFDEFQYIGASEEEIIFPDEDIDDLLDDLEFVENKS